jgi:hypothetical protein
VERELIWFRGDGGLFDRPGDGAATITEQDGGLKGIVANFLQFLGPEQQSILL